MKILIDLDVTPEDFKRIQVFNIKMMNNKITHKVYEAVQNGIVLPKGHGELVDKEEMRSELARNYNKGFVSWGANEVIGEMIDKLKTIVEADKGDEE